MKHVYEAIIEPQGGFLEARFPDLGIAAQGADMADTALMAQNLLENHIARRLQKGESLPLPTFGNACGEDSCRMVVAVSCDASIPQDETMSVREAADVLGLSAGRVRAMIRDGILRSKKVGMMHLVDAQSVMDRFNAPGHPGRPKRKTTTA